MKDKITLKRRNEIYKLMLEYFQTNKNPYGFCLVLYKMINKEHFSTEGYVENYPELMEYCPEKYKEYPGCDKWFPYRNRSQRMAILQEVIKETDKKLGLTKRISKKNQYIANLVWEKDHFETEVKRVKEQSAVKSLGHPSRIIWYHGDAFNVSEANQRIKELTAELEHVQSDPSYTPWKDDFDFEKHTIEDIKRNLDEQEIPREGISPQQMEAIKDGAVEIPDQGVHPSMFEAECPGCGKVTSDWEPESGSGVCSSCKKEGLWVDPAGGIHTDDEEDPAAQYE